MNNEKVKTQAYKSHLTFLSIKSRTKLKDKKNTRTASNLTNNPPSMPQKITEETIVGIIIFLRSNNIIKNSYIKKQ